MVVGTPGERLLDALRHLAAGEIDLLTPPGVVLHHINSFVDNEFEAVAAALCTKHGITEVQAHRTASVQRLSLEALSSPTTVNLPRLTPLVKPFAFVLGSLPGCLLYTRRGTHAPNLPQAVAAIHLCPVRQWVTVTAMFPSVVKVNGAVLDPGRPTRLLVGDSLTVYESVAHDRPVLSYQYLRVTPPGMAALPASMRLHHSQQQVAAAAMRAGRTGGRAAVSGSGVGGIRLQSVDAPAEYRNLHFGHFATTFRAGDSREYQDL